MANSPQPGNRQSRLDLPREAATSVGVCATDLVAVPWQSLNNWERAAYNWRACMDRETDLAKICDLYGAFERTINSAATGSH